MPYLETPGFCPTCSSETVFRSDSKWLRDFFLCTKCGSLPRERALMLVLERYYSNWRQLRIHESSPADRGASRRIRSECADYLASHYFPDVPPGQVKRGFRCEDLERLTFADHSIDIHLTQDVMEHLPDPRAAFREIARTLRPGGAHIFTVPLVNKRNPSRVRASRGPDGSMLYHLPEMYHGNPIDNSGSLVTVDWGYDICDYIYQETGLVTHTLVIDDLSKGIRAEYIEVLVTLKPAGGQPLDAFAQVGQ